LFLQVTEILCVPTEAPLDEQRQTEMAQGPAIAAG